MSGCKGTLQRSQVQIRYQTTGGDGFKSDIRHRSWCKAPITNFRTCSQHAPYLPPGLTLLVLSRWILTFNQICQVHITHPLCVYVNSPLCWQMTGNLPQMTVAILVYYFPKVIDPLHWIDFVCYESTWLCLEHFSQWFYFLLSQNSEIPKSISWLTKLMLGMFVLLWMHFSWWFHIFLDFF